MVSLSFVLAMLALTLLAVQLTLTFGLTGQLFKDHQRLREVAKNSPSFNILAVTVAEPDQKPKSAKTAVARDRSELGINVSRGAPAAAPPAPSATDVAWINSLNKFLAGSPMAGMGEVFYKAARQHGVDPRLSPAIAKVESGLGRAIPGGFNAFGMTAGTAPGHGRIGRWQAFSSWQDAIESNVAFIKSKWGASASPYNMRGYATSYIWPRKVSAAMSMIENPAPELVPQALGPYPEEATPQ